MGDKTDIAWTDMEPNTIEPPPIGMHQHRPGSPAAHNEGCSCGASVNNGGRGTGRGFYFVKADCLLHGDTSWDRRKMQATLALVTELDAL